MREKGLKITPRMRTDGVKCYRREANVKAAHNRYAQVHMQ